jgi:hypothetical protein
MGVPDSWGFPALVSLATVMISAHLLRWPVGAALGLAIAGLVTYSIGRAVNGVAQSAAFLQLVSLVYFQCLNEALKKDGEEDGHATIPYHRLYAAAVLDASPHCVLERQSECHHLPYTPTNGHLIFIKFSQGNFRQLSLKSPTAVRCTIFGG